MVARSQHMRSHPWQGHEETGQARQIRTSGITKSCPSTHLKDFCLSDACYIRLLPNFCAQVEGLPQSLSKQNQLRTLINRSPGQWNPIRLSRMKGVFQFKLLCWHFILAHVFMPSVLMCTTAHNTLIIKQHLSHKDPNRHRALWGLRKPY